MHRVSSAESRLFNGFDGFVGGDGVYGTFSSSYGADSFTGESTRNVVIGAVVIGTYFGGISGGLVSGFFSKLADVAFLTGNCIDGSSGFNRSAVLIVILFSSLRSEILSTLFSSLRSEILSTSILSGVASLAGLSGDFSR